MNFNTNPITFEDAERILMSMKQFLEVGDSQGAVMHVAGLVNMKATLNHASFEEVLKNTPQKPKRIKQKAPKPDKEAAKLAKAKKKAEKKANAKKEAEKAKAKAKKEAKPVCSICHMPGHNARTCPCAGISETVKCKCSHCHQIGHSIRKCPILISSKK